MYVELAEVIGWIKVKSQGKRKREKRKREKSLLLKRIRADKTSTRVLGVCVALIVAIIVLCFFHINQIIDLFQDIYVNRAYEDIEMKTDEITRVINRKSDHLLNSANTFSSIIKDENLSSVTFALTALSEGSEFETLYYIKRSNNMCYRNDGEVKSYNFGLIEEQYRGDYKGVGIINDFRYSDGSDVVFICPVSRAGVSTGYLLGVTSLTSDFAFITDSGNTKFFDSLIVDGAGNVVYSSASNKFLHNCQGKNFYSEILDEIIGEEYKAVNIAEEIKLSVIGDTIGTIQNVNSTYGKSQIMYASIPGTKGWTYISIMFESTLITYLRPIIVESLVTVIGMILIIILLVIIVSRFTGAEQQKIHDLAYVDELTSAPNENAFKERAREILDSNEDLSYVLICFDIQNFRYINEGYGHEKADVILKALAEALSECFSYNETYARIGADRFIGLTIDDGRNEYRTVFIDEHIAKATRNILLNYPIKIKTGLYYIRNKQEKISSMIDKANLARKSIKGGSSAHPVAEYVDKLMEETRKQEHIESRMEMALQNDEFVPFLQPKWNMKENHICGAEALVRWRYPDGSIVPPGDFIPLFEKNGFIEKVDFYMLESVCKYLRRMIDEGRVVYPVSINQSRFLMHNPEYVAKVQKILLKYKIPKGLVEFEITETVFTHDMEHMLEVMNQLKDFNVELSMDDFGSGYSSLNLLRDIPFDVLKIDRGFLDESTQSDTGKWILRKIVEMAEGLKLKVICEGVETQEHVDMLLEIGCIYAQGYKYSRPISLEEFIEKYNVKD